MPTGRKEAKLSSRDVRPEERCLQGVFHSYPGTDTHMLPVTHTHSHTVVVRAHPPTTTIGGGAGRFVASQIATAALVSSLKVEPAGYGGGRGGVDRRKGKSPYFWSGHPPQSLCFCHISGLTQRAGC